VYKLQISIGIYNYFYNYLFSN